MAKRKQKMTERGGTRFDKRLEDYSALTRISTATGSPRSQSGNWAIYAAAVGSALAMGSNASASIIYCGPSNNYCEAASQHPVLTAKSSTNGVHIPLLGNVGLQLKLEVGTGTGPFGFFGNASAQGGGKVNFFNSLNAPLVAKTFSSGALIGPGLLPNHATLKSQAAVEVIFKSTSNSGHFVSGAPGIIGLDISQQGSQHTQNDYGWMRLVFTENQSGYPETLTAIDWAIQTDGTPIEAGVVPASTPEPGTMGLGLLAVGAAGVTALRRRRKVSA